MANRARPRSAPEPAGGADRARMFGSRQHSGRREKINRATPASSASRVRRRVFTYLRWILPRGRPTFGSSRTPTPTGFLRDAPCAEPWAYLVGAGFQPLAAAASDEISPRSGHLSGRVAPPTRVGEAGGSRNLTGAPPPQALFFGAPPRFFGQDQRNGVETAAQGKDNQQQYGEFRPPQKPTQKPPASSRSPGAVIQCFFSRPSLSSRGCRAPCPTGYRSARRTGAASQGLSCCPL